MEFLNASCGNICIVFWGIGAHLPSVRRGQAVSGAVVSVDLELLDAIHPLQCSKALKWHFRCACNKLQEFSPVSLVKGSQCTPEPLDLWSEEDRKFKPGREYIWRSKCFNGL